MISPLGDTTITKQTPRTKIFTCSQWFLIESITFSMPKLWLTFPLQRNNDFSSRGSSTGLCINSSFTRSRRAQINADWLERPSTDSIATRHTKTLQVYALSADRRLLVVCRWDRKSRLHLSILSLATCRRQQVFSRSWLLLCRCVNSFGCKKEQICIVEFKISRRCIFSDKLNKRKSCWCDESRTLKLIRRLSPTECVWDSRCRWENRHLGRGGSSC